MRPGQRVVSVFLALAALGTASRAVGQVIVVDGGRTIAGH